MKGRKKKAAAIAKNFMCSDFKIVCGNVVVRLMMQRWGGETPEPVGFRFSAGFALCLAGNFGKWLDSAFCLKVRFLFFFKVVFA